MTIFTFFQRVRSHAQSDLRVQNATRVPYFSRKGLLVGLVFIDRKKAFDTVDHDIFCKKLAHYGVQHRELSWFKSYLTNCKQFCRVNGVDSDFGI